MKDHVVFTMKHIYSKIVIRFIKRRSGSVEKYVPVRISIPISYRSGHASTNCPYVTLVLKIFDGDDDQKLRIHGVIFCGVRISILVHGIVNNGANNNKLTTLAQCLRPCHVMTYLSCKPLVCSQCVFRDSHELFITKSLLTVICNVLWLTICSFLLFWI